KELCAIPCEASNANALDAAARWCRDRLRAAGFADARELRVDRAPALVVGETGASGRTLVGVQHYDVQPAVPLDLWKTKPYEPSLGGKGILYCHFRVRTMSRDAHSGGATHYPNAAWRLTHAFATLMDEHGHVCIDGFYDDVRKPTKEEQAMLERMPFDGDATR